MTLKQQVDSKMWLLTCETDSETAALAGETYKDVF